MSTKNYHFIYAHDRFLLTIASLLTWGLVGANPRFI